MQECLYFKFSIAGLYFLNGGCRTREADRWFPVRSILQMNFGVVGVLVGRAQAATSRPYKKSELLALQIIVSAYRYTKYSL